jgi:hypothetical protein
MFKLSTLAEFGNGYVAWNLNTSFIDFEGEWVDCTHYKRLNIRKK